MSIGADCATASLLALLGTTARGCAKLPVFLRTFSMAVDKKVVEQVAHLARLQIDADSVAEYASEMSGVLDLAAQMDTVDTSAIEPMAHPTNAVQRLREDEVTEKNRREAFQQVAPSVESGYYLVPPVIE